MDHLRITVEGKVYDVVVEKIDDRESGTAAPRAPVIRSAGPAVAARPAPDTVPQVAAGDGDAASPLAGIVQAVEVQVGAVVSEGDLIITALKAMDVGDSFLLGGITVSKKTMMYRTINAVSDSGKRFTTRTEANGIRVWRTA